MAPIKRADETATGGTRPETGIGNKVWVILAIVFAGVCVLGIAAGLVSKWYKKRRPYHEVAEKDGPAMSETPSKRMTSSTFGSDDGDKDHPELQRQQIIHKSLASRPSSREAMRPSCEPVFRTQPDDAGEQASAEACTRDRDNGEPVTPLESPVGLVNDWKRWEAKLRQDNTRCLTHHPGIDEGLHPLHNHAAPVHPAAYVPARPLTYHTGATECSSASPNNGQTCRFYPALSRTGETEHV
ncbi:Uncharacterized protein TPAR_03237 [Tolypocladium paradoxum]|uniref:Uncharacterized protein n=1 Tax=Tolypocladium paradoxum TaxID=94208 RepID=A0A2S4L2A8_9HYPO|nr:Uncharacterized protein TPAR_03237 [Tolypocladium paradoxum]